MKRAAYIPFEQLSLATRVDKLVRVNTTPRDVPNISRNAKITQDVHQLERSLGSLGKEVVSGVMSSSACFFLF